MKMRRVKFLVLMLSVAVIFALTGSMPVCQCGESSDSLKEVSLRFLEEVVDIRLDAYDLTEYRCITSDSLVQTYLHPGHVETWVDFTLSSGSDEFQVDLYFMDGEFYHFDLDGGTPKTNTLKTANLLDCATTVLERYRVQFNATHCSQLAPMLTEIISLDREQTLENDEAQLEFQLTSKDHLRFKWTPKVDGIKMQKSFSISIDKNGVLTHLTDWLRIINIGTSEVNISEEQAVNIALDLAQKRADEVGTEIDSYETSLMLNNDPLTGRGDCFTLYPAWTVMFYYDNNTRPANIYGCYVCIWADTGEVFIINSQGFYGGESTSLNPWTIILLASTFIAVPTILVLYQKRKRSRIN
jgi:hypothetical protein